MKSSASEIGNIFILSVVLFCINEGSTYNISKYERRCPYRSEWIIKAAEKCGNVSMYNCVLDDNTNVYNEFCRKEPVLWQKGSKAVLRGNIDEELCSKENYQPFLFSTNGTSKCVFSKSLCSSQGLVIYKNGSTSEDRQCRCNHVNGYSFVVDSTNPSYCSLHHADCSCYQKLCRNGSFVLSSDYNCILGASIGASTEIPIIDKRSTMKFGTKSFYVSDHSNWFLTVVKVLILISLVVTIVFIAVLFLHSVFQPSLSPEHDFYYSSRGNEIKIQCKTESYFRLKFVRWRKKSADGTEIDIPLNDIRYKILQNIPFGIIINETEKNEIHDDSGTYTCFVKSFFYGIIPCSVTVIVDDQNAFAITPSYLDVDSNTILLKCTMPRIQNQFMAKFATWKRLKDDGIEAIVGTTDSDNGKYCISPDPPELQIINSNENNRGKYICHLSDGIEERIADVFLDCPKISVDEKQILASANEKKSLNYYISTSLPAVKSLIKKQNEEEHILLPTDENDDFMSLEITSTCLIDKGTYVCQAKNSLGTGRASTELYVGERPCIEISEICYKTQRQNNVTLLCEVTSDLTLIKLVWEKNNFSLIETNDESKFSGGNLLCPSLTIKDAEPTDTGSYVCYATNDIGTSESSAITLLIEETVLDDSFRAPYYTGKDTDSEEKFAQVVLGKWDAEYARAKSKHLIDEELRVVLIGKTGAGKSATCNMIAGKEIFESEMAAGSVTKTTQFKRVTVLGKKILLIDTPGILDSEVNQQEIEDEISKCVRFGAPGIHAILFVMPIGRFTEEDIKVIQTFLGYFGREKMEQHVIVVFTFGDRLIEGKKKIKDYLQKAPEGIRCFIERCKERYVVFNNKLSEVESFQQVQGLIHFITSHKYEKVLSYYTDKLFEAAEKNLREKEDEIQRTLEDMYNKRVEEMQREFNKIKEQITNLYKSGVQVEAAKEYEKQLQELKIRSEEELSETKQLYESRMSKVRDEARLGAESDSVMLNFNTQQSPGNEN